MSKPKLNYSISYSSEELQILNEPQVYYALISLAAEGEKGYSSQIPKNICFVVDASTSMRGESIDVVKQTLSKIPKILDEQETIYTTTIT